MSRLRTGESKSLWMSLDSLPAEPLFQKHLRADVCIVGAGIAGISAAYWLAREGIRVVVVTEDRIGSGQTGRTTAHLSNAMDHTYLQIEKWHGLDGAKLAASSHTWAIDQIEYICEREGIECEFRRIDGFHFGQSRMDTDFLTEEIKAVHRAGLTSAKLLSKFATRGAPFDGPCIHYPMQAELHPLKYLYGLANSAAKMGARIYTNVRVEFVDGGQPCIVSTDHGFKIECNAVFVATHAPFIDRLVMITKQASYQTYVIGLRIEKDSIPKALYWDHENPFHYARVVFGASSDVLLIGGEDHKTGQAEDESACLHRLERWARQRLPQAGETMFRWSGQIEQSMDGLAFIGRNPMDAENVFICTGDSGMGMTHGTIAGRIISDLIAKRENPWISLYDPSRKRIGAARNWLDENTNSLLQYREHFTGSEITSIASLPRGEGAVIREGLWKSAIYRDEYGVVHELSAFCPHLGGIVHWNKEEKAWDCPCHGSRFAPLGKVIHGPSKCGLKQMRQPSQLPGLQTDKALIGNI
jgi:glycine/D-amino acid oxidase-like deaminating enzyme/nitrite reductase/ring-hydroxylating ferredoxin subunit